MKEQCLDVQSQFGTSPFARLACFILLSICAVVPLGTDACSGDSRDKPILKVQEVKSPGGITAWLVENHSLAFLTLRFSFQGGSAQDPPGKPGVSYFLSRMLDQGAGGLDAVAFQQREDDIGMRLRFDSDKDRFSGMLETLTERRNAAIELLRLALNKPRFDRSAMERTLEQVLAKMAADAEDPKIVATKTWNEFAFPGHPYGRPKIGTQESVKTISAHDLSTFHKRNFARNGLNVVAVGDVDRATLKPLLDRVFGALPSEQDLTPVKKVTVRKSAKITAVRMPMPQSVVLLGLQGIERTDPDFVAADMISHMIGGDSDFAHLWTEVREKRGLAYEAFSLLDPNSKAPTLTVRVATRPNNVAQVITVIREEMRRMAQDGVSASDLANAKDYLTGSFPLNFNTNANTAKMLLRIQEQKLGIDYVNTRNAKIEAVSLEDIKRVAARLLKVNDVEIVVVGDSDESELRRLVRDPSPQ